MKTISAQQQIEGYKTKQFAIEQLVPASIYDNIPDEEKLRPELEQGVLDKPLIVFETDNQYWQSNHLRLYKSGNPDLPDEAPETDGKVYVVWFGRQRFQLMKDMGYTHVDVVTEKVFHKMITLGHKNK
jgi:hypothetical protein